MITVIPLDQEWIWLDTTTEVAPFRLLSANLRKKRALVFRQDLGRLRSDCVFVLYLPDQVRTVD